MRRIDPFQWSQVAGEFPVTNGRLSLRLAQPGPVYASAFGYRVLIGHGVEFDVQLPDGEWTVEVPEGVDAFLFTPETRVFEPEGEVFTNADRLPMVSGSVLEVQQAMRLLQIERANLMREVRKAAREQRRAVEGRARREADADDAGADAGEVSE